MVVVFQILEIINYYPIDINNKLLFLNIEISDKIIKEKKN